MPYTVEITLDPYTNSLVDLNRKTWELLIKSVHGGTLLNLGGFTVRLGDKKKSVRDILATKYDNIDEIDLSFLELLNNSGKLILASFGSMITMVNSVNGILNSRVGSAIWVDLQHPTVIPPTDGTPYRLRNEDLYIGPNPVGGVRRGDALFDPDVLDTIVSQASKMVSTIRLKELRFGIRIVGNEMFVELTYDGRYSAAFVGKMSVINPTSILLASIRGFDEYVRNLTADSNTVSSASSKGKREALLARPSPS
jgi:hypothetical protein